MSTPQAFIYPAAARALLLLSQVKRRKVMVERLAMYYQRDVYETRNPDSARCLIACTTDAQDLGDIAHRLESDIVEGRYCGN